MKGDRKRKSCGFQRGHKFLEPTRKKARTDEFDTVTDEFDAVTEVKFQRLSKSELDIVTNLPYGKYRNSGDELSGVQTLNLRLLRPKLDPVMEVDSNLGAGENNRLVLNIQLLIININL